MNNDENKKSVSFPVPQVSFFQWVLVIALVGGAFYLGMLYSKVQILEKGGSTTDTKTTGTTGVQGQTTPQALKIDAIRKAFDQAVVKFGESKNKLILIDVSDPSCPYCSIAAGQNPELNTQAGDRFKLVADGGTYVAPVPEMKKLVDEGKASYAFLFTPGHGNGEMGTKALYCAFEQGKYWEVHNKLMSKEGYDLLNNTVQNSKDKSGDLTAFLAGTSDTTKLKECIDSGKYDAQLQKDVQTAGDLQISGTPGFYINETKFAGAYSWTDMQSAATAALK
jgi:protein-disulfide isomerase